MLRLGLRHDTTTDPGVPAHCVFGSNVQTMVFPLRFATIDSLDTMTGITFGNGDGTVQLPSLEICERWSSTVRTYRFTDMQHGRSVETEQLANIIEAVALNNEDVWKAWRSPLRAELISSGAHHVVPVENIFIAPANDVLG
eukprot:NODE_9860_length_1394_cov_3.826361.p3 GENE.NODE_9860_length_1394_cov_3.826361~~NODE_9860_length_1394_cov_3.826361.p3  ORF type:complete len:141 (+),score=35.32 NODE_9860_length_1394_cov_3.826361:815-1237(+)